MDVYSRIESNHFLVRFLLKKTPSLAGRMSWLAVSTNNKPPIIPPIYGDLETWHCFTHISWIHPPKRG